MNLSDSSNIYVGNTPATKVMVGSTQVWPTVAEFGFKGVGTLQGSGNNIAVSNFSNIVPNIAPTDLIVACFKWVTDISPNNSVPNWTIVTTSGWDIGQPTERGVFCYTTGNTPLSYTLNTTANWILAIAVFSAGSVRQFSIGGGWDSYTLPSMSGLSSGSHLLHMKMGDRDSSPGASSTPSGWIRQSTTQLANTGSLTLDTMIPSGSSYSGQYIGVHKGRGIILEISPTLQLPFFATWPGVNGTAWPSEWITQINSASEMTIDQNGTGSGQIRITAAGGSSWGLARHSTASLSDVDILVNLASNSNSGQARILARWDGNVYGNGDLYNGYVVTFRNNTANAIQIRKYINGTETRIDSITHSALTGAHWLRFRLQGSNVKLRWWTGSEPVVWNSEITDTSIAGPGYVGLGQLRFSSGASAATFNSFEVTES